MHEDLTADWDGPEPQRILKNGRHADLHPVSELGHPLIRKAVETFGEDPGQDNPEGIIGCTRPTQFYEIKMGQWRGAVWRDPKSGVHWLCAAGLAKGEHRDHDDFYAELEALHARGESAWAPSELDDLLLRQETLSRVVTTWRLEIQAATAQALRAVATGGTTRFEVKHPLKKVTSRQADPGESEAARLLMAEVEIEVAPSSMTGLLAEDCLVEFLVRPQFRGSELSWQLTLTVLTALCPTFQEWDVAGGIYSMIGEVGAWSERTAELDDLVARNELAAADPGKVAHYCHTEHLAGSTIEGTAVRGMCGTFFVPTRDHEKLPKCPDCASAYDALPS